jgi:hypothetical protein
MALSFNGTSQYGEATLSLAATPLTLAAWYRPSNVASLRHILALGNSGEDTQNAIRANGTTIQAASFQSSSASADIGAALSNGVLAHVAGVFRGPADRSAYLNGGSRANSATSRTVSAFSRARIGVRARSTLAEYGQGEIAEAAVWNIDLNDAEIAALGRGFSPLLIRRQNLIAYWPMIGRASAEPDLVGGFTLTLANAPSQATHPRVRAPGRWVYPRRATGSVVAIAPAVGTLTLAGATPTVRAIDNPRIVVPPSALALQAAAPLPRLTSGSTQLFPPPSPWQAEATQSGAGWTPTPVAPPGWTTLGDPSSGWSEES